MSCELASCQRVAPRCVGSVGSAPHARSKRTSCTSLPRTAACTGRKPSAYDATLTSAPCVRSRWMEAVSRLCAQQSRSGVKPAWSRWLGCTKLDSQHQRTMSCKHSATFNIEPLERVDCLRSPIDPRALPCAERFHRHLVAPADDARTPERRPEIKIRSIHIYTLQINAF